jgi:hypothetical protein
MATIIDANFLATQSAFYLNSQNGDKVIVFPEARKAFIYSVDRNIIVNSGPLITQPSPVEPFTVEIRNGSGTAGLGERIRTDLEAQGVTVTAVTNAANSEYSQTQVINLTQAVPAEVVDALATYLSGTVASTRPAAESNSSADVLIIVGAPATGENPEPGATSTPSPQPDED